MLKRWVLLSLAVAAILPSAGAQDEGFGDKVRVALQEGMDLYKRGKYQEASSKFEEAFQMKPDSDQVYAFIKRAGENIVAGMMNSPERPMQDIGRRLFELAKPGEPLREKKEVVLKYIEDLKSESHEVWRNGFWHLKNFGPYCVRFVLPSLGNPQDDKYRSRVILLLTEIGVDGSLALIEALDSKNDTMRQNAAIVLGNIKDERAIPALKWAVENPNEKPEVKKFANESLRKIIRTKDAAQWRKATDYYYELATKFYYGHSSVIYTWQRAYLIWKWDAEKDVLTERKVARYAYNEQLAEEALFDLLELDPAYKDASTGFSALSLLACVEFAQALEAEAAVDAAVDALKVGELDKDGLVKLLGETEGLNTANLADLKGKIDGAASDMDVQKVVVEYWKKLKLAKTLRTNVVGQTPGKRSIYEGLARSLTDGNYLVAKACIDAIAEMGRAEDLPAPAPAPDAEKKEEEAKAEKGGDGTMGFPLIEALTNEDKRVRYAAARAMVALNPQRRKVGMELVIPNLIDALGEQGVRVALVIYDIQDDNDRNFINSFKKMLASINIFPVIAASGSEGIIKAKQFPTEDLIIVQKKICAQVYFREADTRKQIVETVFDTLRDDVRTKNIPRLVLGDNPQEVADAGKEYLEKGTAFAVIGKDADKLGLQALLEKAFDLPEAKKDSKDRADEIARDAAEALADVDPTNTLYPYRDAVEALIKTVAPDPLREDFIRIPSARALGRFGDQRAIDVLAKVVEDKDADAEKAARQKGVRLASGKALSEVFRKTGVSPVKEVFEVLVKNLKDGDYDIEFAVGEAVGNATLSVEQRRDAAKARRVARDTYTADDP
ncbi:MAG TPA: HEAT repeat domain-containing protein [Planctomycetota bacterium]